MKQTLIIIGGILGAMIGMGFVMPAVAQWKHEGAMIGISPALFLLGLILTRGGVVTAIRALKNRVA